jgi:hypothetical protein
MRDALLVRGMRYASIINHQAFMISLTCTNCRTVLEIDDAFAGGVCRCQHCGTIQTVPSHLKRPQRAAAPGQAPGTAVVPASNGDGPTAGQKTLYQRRSRAESEGTGLEDLADVVAGSGLGSGITGSGIGSGRLRSGLPSAAAGAAPRHSSFAVFVGMGLALAALGALLVWLAMGRPGMSSHSQASGDGAGPSGTDVRPSARASTGPSFCDVKLEEPVIIYVLDRGNGTRDVFDTLKEVTYRSIQSLGSDRKFQVIFWNNGSESAYPSGFPGYARSENLSACRRAMEDTTAFGQSDAASALNKAFNNKPGAIVLATGKGLDLDPSFVEQVMGLRRSTDVKVHAFALGDSESPALREVARRTGGEYRTLNAGALRQYAE